MIRTILALLKKDLLVESSYKLSFCFNIFSVVIAVLTYFFINKLFGQNISPYLGEFGVDYFSYVLLSLAFFSYIGAGLGSFSSRIRNEQLQGTLEALLLTPTRVSVLLLSMALWNLIFATLDMLIYIGLGIFLFKIDFSKINLLSASLSLFLTIISFSSLGIISASFILIFKKGNPVGWIIGSLEGLLGGVYFPIAVLPASLQLAAKFLPITYAIRAIELSVYQGAGISALKHELFALGMFSLILGPLSLRVFTRALTIARRNGSLVQY